MKPFAREVLRSISRSLSRFFAIFAIVALGAGFYAGLHSSGADMRASADAYYDESRLMDVRVLSTRGLTQDDVRAAAAVPGVEDVMATHTADVLTEVDGMEQAVRVHGISSGGPEGSNMNRPALLSGRWPQNPGECVAGAKKAGIAPPKIGDTLQIASGRGSQNGQLRYGAYRIVGIVTSPYYISFNLGTTGIGSGQINNYIYIREEDFSQTVYSSLFLRVKGAGGLNTYSEQYDDTVAPVVSALRTLAAPRQEIRYRALYDQAQRKLDDGRTEYEKNRAEAQRKLADAKNELDRAERDIASGEEQLAETERKTAGGKARLAQGETELARKQKELDAGRERLAQAKKTLDESARRWEAGTKELAERRAETGKQLAGAEQLIGSGLPGAPASREEWEQMHAAALRELSEAQKQLDAAKVRLDAGTKVWEQNRAKLEAGQRELDAGKSELEASRAQLKNARTRISAGKRDLARSKAALAAGRKEYETNRTETERKLSDAQKKLVDGQKQLESLEKPVWYVLDRHANEGFESFGSDAGRMDSISGVFPMIFFLVAALVALTTMTRMVEEERTLFGVERALGFGKAKVASKYLIYAALASVTGSIAGVAVGMRILPSVVWKAYGILYTGPALVLPPNLPQAVSACAASVGCTLFATWAACGASLRETPANLILPRAPKPGKRILLERVRPLWARLSFIQKVTARNLFRYKRRFFMTVIGIAGCTGLLLTGFGLRDSITEILSTQFDEICRYNAAANLRDGSVSAGFASLLNDRTQFDRWLLLSGKNTDISANGKTVGASLTVPKEPGRLADFIRLRDRRSGQTLPFNDRSVLVTEKLAKQLGVHAGDSIALPDGAGRPVSLKVTGITENYVFHYVYLSPALYREKLGKDPEYNQVVAVSTAAGKDARNAQFRRAVAQEGVATFIRTGELVSKYSDMIRSVNLVVMVLIVSAGMLAFIVLYNLTNINVTERRREIATIKVLGFFDNEVSAYIYRETFLLTLIGCLFGLGLGVGMNAFVVQTAEIDAIMFGRVIRPISFVWSAALTLLFSAFVNLVMYRKLRNVDMVESLKSVD